MNYNDIFKKYSGAKEIHALSRTKKMTKKEILFDWLVALFTPLSGIVSEADLVADMGRYFLVVGENQNKLVRVMKEELTEQVITVDCSKKKFVFNGNKFIKVRKIYG